MAGTSKRTKAEPKPDAVKAARASVLAPRKRASKFRDADGNGDEDPDVPPTAPAAKRIKKASESDKPRRREVTSTSKTTVTAVHKSTTAVTSKANRKKRDSTNASQSTVAKARDTKSKPSRATPNSEEERQPAEPELDSPSPTPEPEISSAPRVREASSRARVSSSKGGRALVNDRDSSPAKRDGSVAEANSEASDDEDDQTAALLKGFGDSDSDDSSEDEGVDAQAVPNIPKTKHTDKQLEKANARADTADSAVAYIGRIPHGFFEHQMRAYFSQFGTIRRLRLSRNKKTGHSKHYAFLEFASSEVAEIAVKTMNNYLLFGHILKCRVIPNEQIHPNLWKGANRPFKTIPWNKIERRRLEATKTRTGWTRKVKLETSKRRRQSEKMKAMGYDYEPPALKSVDTVLGQPTQVAVAVAADGDEGEPTKEVTNGVSSSDPSGVRDSVKDGVHKGGDPQPLCS